MKIQAATIARTLGQLDPSHQAEYRHNLEAVERELDDLDQAIAKKLAALRGKPFFVFHPAWGYFADDYGLRQVAIEVEGKDPTDQELTELQRAARLAGAKIILVQPEISGRRPGRGRGHRRPRGIGRSARDATFRRRCSRWPT